MKSLPEEYELVSLFECEPILRDSQTKNFHFYYNEAAYHFSNGEETLLVIVEPADGEIKTRFNLLLNDSLTRTYFKILESAL